MREAITQVFQNLRANKLRSFLTMFGILWGVISVVILSATGEGFRRGNTHVLEELGRNIAIVWGGRTSLQTGGERAGRRILLTIDDVRALQRESSMIRVAARRSSRRVGQEHVQRCVAADPRRGAAVPGNPDHRTRKDADSVLG